MSLYSSLSEHSFHITKKDSNILCLIYFLKELPRFYAMIWLVYVTNCLDKIYYSMVFDLRSERALCRRKALLFCYTVDSIQLSRLILFISCWKVNLCHINSRCIDCLIIDPRFHCGGKLNTLQYSILSWVGLATKNYLQITLFGRYHKIIVKYLLNASFFIIINLILDGFTSKFTTTTISSRKSFQNLTYIINM